MPKEEFTDAVMLLKADHRKVEELFGKFQKASGKDKKWQIAQQICKVTVLCEEISHHVKEEEKPKDGFFAQARGTGADLKAMRDQLMTRKQELMTQMEDGGLPPAQLAAVHLEVA